MAEPWRKALTSLAGALGVEHASACLAGGAAALDGFTIDPDLEDGIRRIAGRIAEPAPERVQSEIEMILRTPRAGESMRSMDAFGLLAPLLPELEPLRGLRQAPRHHDHDALDHTLL